VQELRLDECYSGKKGQTTKARRTRRELKNFVLDPGKNKPKELSGVVLLQGSSFFPSQFPFAIPWRSSRLGGSLLADSPEMWRVV
jgi:hypothetical protein